MGKSNIQPFNWYPRLARAGGHRHAVTAPMSGAPGTIDQSRPGAGGAFHPSPHRSYLEFAAVPAALPYVRRHTRQTLATWQLGYLADDVELVVSELVTNAVRASQEAALPIVAAYLALDRDRLAVLIWDASPRPPSRREHDEGAESGRGLELVQALTDDWGVCPGEVAGKVVWAKFSLREPGLSEPGLREKRHE
jgi:anti-sigma regulatory factor (Ser/Thr protein kinase)